MSQALEMTEKELQTKIAALGLPEDDPRIKGIVCQLIGHSRIVELCFGYVSCARCGDQIGDTLGGTYDLSDKIVVGHNCETCRANYAKLNWQDRFMVGDPFTEN